MKHEIFHNIEIVVSKEGPKMDVFASTEDYSTILEMSKICLKINSKLNYVPSVLTLFSSRRVSV